MADEKVREFLKGLQDPLWLGHIEELVAGLLGEIDKNIEETEKLSIEIATLLVKKNASVAMDALSAVMRCLIRQVKPNLKFSGIYISVNGDIFVKPE
jgi:hypothetical protein